MNIAITSQGDPDEIARAVVYEPTVADAFAVRRPVRRTTLLPLTPADWAVFVAVALATFTILMALAVVAS